MAKSVMAVYAHADDVELHCGGTLAKYKAAGYSVSYIMSTNNMSGEWCTLKPDGTLKADKVPWHVMIRQRKLEADQAARECYGTTAVHLDFPQRHYYNDHEEKIDLRYGNPRPEAVPENFPSIVTANDYAGCAGGLEKLILERQPEVIFTHAVVDENPEHTGTAWLVIQAFHAAQKKGFQGSLLFASGRHSAEASPFLAEPETYIDISGQWLREKRMALAMHKCQSAGIFAEACTGDVLEFGKKFGVEAAEGFIVHALLDAGAGELTGELAGNRRGKAVQTV